MSYRSSNYYRPSTFGGFSFFPTVIKWLMITNAAVFVLVNFFGSLTLDGIELRQALYEYLGLMPLGGEFLPWQLITYQFMHADFWHLFFNMFFGLWMFGMEIEHMWGARKFLFFYLLCGVVAGLAQLFLAPLLESGGSDPFIRLVPTVGASGAVYGVMIAFAMMFPDRYVFVYFLIPIKVKYLVILFIVLGMMSVGQPTNIANLAHLGGAFAGYAYMLYDMRRLPLQNVIERLTWWLNSRTVKRSDGEREDVVDAKIYDIQSGSEKEAKGTDEVQRKIDEILDKISRGGYQSLTEEEKKVLFDASKKLN